MQVEQLELFRKSPAGAERHMRDGLNLHELRETLQGLRALAPDSVLAQLAEDKIERLQREADERC